MTRSSGLRFAIITTFYPPYSFGGDATAVRSLTHALARRGHEVDVIHDVDAFRLLNKGGEPAPLNHPPGVRVHSLRSSMGALSCLLTHQTGRPVVHGRQLRRILHAGRFDVIHYHNVSLVGGPSVLRYGRAIKLFTAHEHWLVCPTHLLWRHGRELCTGRQCLRCTLSYRRPPQLWRYTGLMERAARHVDVFLSPSRFSAEKHREFGFPRDLELLPNFLPDRGDISKEESSGEVASNRPFFLFVGRLEKIKGLQDVIPLFGPDGPADLWIAGRGEYEGRLRQLAEGLPRVRFLGFLSTEQLAPLYAKAIAVVMPSLCYEVLAMVVLEAFREGTPVLARRRGPFPELIEQTQSGLLFDTPEDLRQALDRLASDVGLRELLGAAARRIFVERWSESVVLDQYFSIIRRVATRRRIQHVLDVLGTEQDSETVRLGDRTGGA